jgi:hypothetical protein
MIREEQDLDERIRLLEELNTSLPAEKRMALPSLITRDYVSRAVDIIEETTYSSHER